jgi:hypothetical protein
MGAVRTVSLSLVVAALVAFAAAPAQAQDAEKARQLFQQGSKYYDLGQFDKAIEAWQQGYDQKPIPGFLYNIAQAYRQKQDAAKAIFFYKGYLRNSPKAHNRARSNRRSRPCRSRRRHRHAERRRRRQQHAATAEQQHAAAAEQQHAAAAAELDADGDVTDRPERHGGATAAAGVHGRAAHDGRRGPAAADVHEHAPHRRDGGHRSGFWQSGVNGEPKPSFVFNATAGYTFGTGDSRFRFRLGGMLGYTFLGANEDNSNVTFVSFLLDPRLEIRLTQSGRLYADVGFGLGVQALFGVEPRSKLLAPSEMLVVNGAQSMVVTRLAAGLGFRRDPGHRALHVAGADEQPEEASLLRGHRPRRVVVRCLLPVWTAVDAPVSEGPGRVRPCSA